MHTVHSSCIEPHCGPGYRIYVGMYSALHKNEESQALSYIPLISYVVVSVLLYVYAVYSLIPIFVKENLLIFMLLLQLTF